MSPSADRRVPLTVGGIRVVVDLAMGARAVSWQVDGVELLGGGGTDAVEFGMYPMAPWAGRVRGNEVHVDGRAHALPVTYQAWALHGTVLAQPAEAIAHDQSEDDARLVARVDTHPGWPWPTSVDITWEVRADRVTTHITVRALRDSFPVVVGWHPWFRRSLGVGGALEWSLDATGRLVRGDDHLPTGESVAYAPADGPFDDAFRATRATVRWPGAFSLDIDGGGPWFVVFDERPDCVCVEPQSGPPDGLRAGFGESGRMASPGDPVTLTSTWTIRREPPAGPA